VANEWKPSGSQTLDSFVVGVHVCGCRAHVGSMGNRHAGIAGECWDSLGPGFTLLHYRQGGG